MTAAHLFTALMHMLYASLESKLDYIETRLIDIQNEIFREREKEMVTEISTISRRLITFRQTLKAHDDVFRDAKVICDEHFPKQITLELNDLHNEYFHIIRRTTALFEALEELRDTNMALLTTKQNEIMKTLTVMAFITFPLMLLTSMFGMNTETSPIIGEPGDFWIVLGMMVTATIAFFIYFKFRRWI
jgi:magnesium transporter